MTNLANTAATQAALEMSVLGIRVNRGIDTLPQGAVEDLFTITGGRILLMGIIGEVTTVFGVVGNIALAHNPSGAGTTTNFSAVAAGGALEAGALISIEGTAATATTLAVGGAVAMQDRPVIMTAGTIALDVELASTGAAKWSMWYLPLDPGAYVTATAV